jgi:hypothetical protein
MSEKGFLASLCDFFKSLFSSEPAPATTTATEPATSSAATKGDGLTGVERYIRNKASITTQLTGVEKYIRNKVANTTQLSSVE